MALSPPGLYLWLHIWFIFSSFISLPFSFTVCPCLLCLHVSLQHHPASPCLSYCCFPIFPNFLPSLTHLSLLFSHCSMLGKARHKGDFAGFGLPCFYVAVSFSGKLLVSAVVSVVTSQQEACAFSLCLRRFAVPCVMCHHLIKSTVKMQHIS